MGQNMMPSPLFIRPRRMLKWSCIFLLLIFSLAKCSVFKSAWTSTAVLISLTPLLLAADNLPTSSFFHHWPSSHEFWDNSSVPLNSFQRLNYNSYCNISVFCLLIQCLMFILCFLLNERLNKILLPLLCKVQSLWYSQNIM